MSRRAILALVVVSTVICGAASACSSFDAEPTEPTTDGGGTTDGSAPIDPPAEASVDGAGPSDARIDAGPPPGMVLVPGGAKPFFIDATEVRHGDYATFLAAPAVPFASDPRCAWKSGITDPVASADPNLPVAGIDWCDALFYCKSVGKRLCGAITGGPTPAPQIENATVSQWLFACAGSGATARYSYGATHVADRCNDSSNAREPVKSRPECVGVGPTKGVFDLSGNVAEWEDACIEPKDGGTGPTGSCTVRTGGFQSGPAESRCDVHDERQRQDTYDDVGFRCCKDL